MKMLIIVIILPKFNQYQLAGEKENYKEVLITMPEKKTNAQKNITDFFEGMKAKYGEGFVGKLTKEEKDVKHKNKIGRAHV